MPASKSRKTASKKLVKGKTKKGAARTKVARRKPLPKLVAATINFFQLGGINSLFGLAGSRPVIQVAPEIVFNTGRTYKDGRPAPDGIEVHFPVKAVPLPKVREQLKELGFKWHNQKSMWYAQDSPAVRRFVEQFANGTLVEATEASEDFAQKNWFWAPVKDLRYVPKTATIKVLVRGDIIYPENKQAFVDRFANYQALIADKKVYFKKFWQRDGDADQTEPGNSEPTAAANKALQSSPQSASRPAAASGDDYDRIAEKLRNLADGMQKQIDAKFNPAIAHQNYTRRRASIATSMRADGQKMRDAQEVLYTLAKAWEDRTIDAVRGQHPALAMLRTRKAAEAFVRYREIEKHQGIVRSVSQELKELGFATAQEWGAAVDVIEQLQESTAKTLRTITEELQSKIAQQDMAVKGQKLPGFFPTPPELGHKMLEKLKLEPGLTVLEPSFGRGDLILQLLMVTEFVATQWPYFKKITGIEYQHNLVALAKDRVKLFGLEKGRTVSDHVELLQGDFMQDVHVPGYDRIIMNPPFEDGQDIDHVMRAYNMLAPKGRLVAIMSEGPFFRGDRKSQYFREWLREMEQKGEAANVQLADGSFKSAFNPTGVRTRMVWIDKPDWNAQMARIQNPGPNKIKLRMRAQAEIEIMLMEAEARQRNNR